MPPNCTKRRPQHTYAHHKTVQYRMWKKATSDPHGNTPPRAHASRRTVQNRTTRRQRLQQQQQRHQQQQQSTPFWQDKQNNLEMQSKTSIDTGYSVMTFKHICHFYAAQTKPKININRRSCGETDKPILIRNLKYRLTWTIGVVLTLKHNYPLIIQKRDSKKYKSTSFWRDE